MKTSSHFALVLNIWMAACLIVAAHWNATASMIGCLGYAAYAFWMMIRYAGKSD